MEVKGIIWVGTATDELTRTTQFFSELFGMEVVTDVVGFSRLAASNGDRLEFFGSTSVEHDFLDTGPVAGLWVDDCVGARVQLVEADVEVTEIQTGPDGHHWFYFRAPDGNFYELCEHPGPRPARGGT